MLRNIASQKWRVYAWDATTGLAKTGDAANISAKIQIDDGAEATTNDTAPTEVQATNQKGYYEFDLTQAETNGTKLSLAPQSSTANIVVVACPPVVYTRPQYFSVLGIESDGDLTKVNTLNGHTAQTGDSYAIVNSGTHGNAALKTLIDNVDNIIDTEFGDLVTAVAVIDGIVDAILLDTAEIGAAGAGLSAIPWNASWDAEVQSEAQDALISYNLDVLAKAAVPTSFAASVASNSILGYLAASSNTANYDRLNDSLQAHAESNATQNSTVLTRLGLPVVDLATDLLTRASQTSVDTIDDLLDTEIAAILAAVDTEIAAIQSTLGSLFTTARTESYRADGATGTIDQMLYELLAIHSERTITSTAVRMNKIDGSTQAFTHLLNDAVTPTAVTRNA